MWMHGPLIDLVATYNTHAGVSASSEVLSNVEEPTKPVFPTQFSTLVEISTIVTTENYDADYIYRWNYDAKLKAARIDVQNDDDVITIIYNGVADYTTTIIRTTFRCYVNNGTGNLFSLGVANIPDFSKYTFAGTTELNYLEVNKWHTNLTGNLEEYYEERLSRRPVMMTYKENVYFTDGTTYLGLVEEPQDPSLFVIPPKLAAQCKPSPYPVFNFPH